MLNEIAKKAGTGPALSYRAEETGTPMRGRQVAGCSRCSSTTPHLKLRFLPSNGPARPGARRLRRFAARLPNWWSGASVSHDRRAALRVKDPADRIGGDRPFACRADSIAQGCIGAAIDNLVAEERRALGAGHPPPKLPTTRSSPW
ncbi:hypothetical protein ACVOMV_25790 [Mesorhizobium atlanticum]